MNRRRFRELVDRVLAEIRPRFGDALQHLEVIIDDWPSEELLTSVGIGEDDDTLYGIYDGVPLTERSTWSDGSPEPVRDTVTIFQGPLEADFQDEAELIAEIRITVVHEVGHHFGLSDDEIDALGYG